MQSSAPILTKNTRNKLKSKKLNQNSKFLAVEFDQPQADGAFHLYLEVGNSKFPVGTFLTEMPPSSWNSDLDLTTLTLESSMASQSINRSETVVIYCISVCLCLNTLSGAHSTVKPLSVDMIRWCYLYKILCFYRLVLLSVNTSVLVF